METQNNNSLGEIGANSIDNSPISEPVKPIVEYNDFIKLDIRLCQIISIEKVEKKTGFIN